MDIVKTFLCSAAVVLGISGYCYGSMNEHPFPPVEDAVAAPDVAKTLKSVKIVFSVKASDIKGPATYTVCAMVPGSARFDFEAKEAAYAAGFDNGKTWGYNNKKGIYNLNSEEEAELCRTLFFIPLNLKFKQPYGEAKWVKDETIDGEEYSCFKSVIQEGSPASVLVWINKKTNLIYKFETSDAMETYVTVFANYRDYNGVKLPSIIIMSNQVGECDVMHVESVEWNLDFNSSFFQQPVQLKK